MLALGEQPDLVALLQLSCAATMNERVPASDVYRIETAHLVQALKDFESGAVSHGFSESTRFDLLIDGRRRYPPKAIVGLAAQHAIGRVLVPGDFSGGESSAAFRLLWDRGFEIATKPSRVGLLDATFCAVRSADQTFLVVESGGGGRNSDYAAGLEALLDGLAELDAIIVDVWIDSVSTRRLPPEDRRLLPAERVLPLRLREVDSIHGLRLALTSAASRTARADDAKGSGNPNKRLRIEVDLPGELSLHELVARLAGRELALETRQRTFVFTPKAPSQSPDDQMRDAIDATVVTRLHAAMQQCLYKDLVARYGKDRVAAEQVTASGCPADIVVERDYGIEVYEIKTAPEPRDCVRQALGQLLEYGYWPGSPPCLALHVVGPSQLDDDTRGYLGSLHETFKSGVDYICIGSEKQT